MKPGKLPSPPKSEAPPPPACIALMPIRGTFGPYEPGDALHPDDVAGLTAGEHYENK